MPKITFYSNDPKFLSPIKERLEQLGYQCDKHVNFEESTFVDSDVYWFDFCDANLIAATKEFKDKLMNKKVIARLHAIEYYMGFHKEIDWSCVSDLIFVSEHMKRLCNQDGELPVRQHVIHNGIDLDKLDFHYRNNGFVIGYAGNIVPDKGIMTMLHYFRELYHYDDRYKLKLIGNQRLGGRNLEYWNYCKKGLPIEQEEATDDINKWMNGIDYLWQPSYAESFSMIVGEAMAKGIKPLINNFYGSEELWPKELIYRNFSEFKNILNFPYDSEYYREFVKRYSFEKEIEQIIKLL